MDNPQTLLAVVLRFFAYTFFIYAVDRWSWGEEREASLFRALGYAILRVLLGTIAGGFILTQFSSSGEGLMNSQNVFFVLTRFFIWIGLLVLLGSRGFRLLVAAAIAMGLHVLLDLILYKPIIYGLPFYS